MGQALVKAVNSDRERAIFVGLPERIYPKGSSPTKPLEETAFLRGEHTFSSGQQIYAYLLFADQGQTIESCMARVALILPSNSEDAYFAFFEARPTVAAIDELMTVAEKKAAQSGRKRLIGPVNGSFWLGYRFKADQFDNAPYLGEPINPAYYPALFSNCSYQLYQRYVSNVYDAPKELPPRMKKRLDDFRGRGIKIRQVKRREMRRLIRRFYHLISELYADFPTFEPISEEQFISQFRSMPLILDRSLVRIAEYRGNTVGFLVAFPDYGLNLTEDRGTMAKLTAIIRKKKYQQAVLLYLGVKPDYLGLGAAMVASLGETLIKRELSLVGALIQESKPTASYAYGEIREQRSYVLLKKDLAN